jgi:hypothetical protein
MMANSTSPENPTILFVTLFKGLKQSPFVSSVEFVKAAQADAAKSVEECRKFVTDLYQSSVAKVSIHTSFGSFSHLIAHISTCSTKIEVTSQMDDGRILGLMRGKSCIPDLTRRYSGYGYNYWYTGALYCL